METISRIYDEYDVSMLTLDEIDYLIQTQGINYAADFGLKMTDATRLRFSIN